MTCVNQPQFKTVLGEVALCTKMAQFDGERESKGVGWGGSEWMSGGMSDRLCEWIQNVHGGCMYV